MNDQIKDEDQKQEAEESEDDSDEQPEEHEQTEQLIIVRRETAFSVKFLLLILVVGVLWNSDEFWTIDELKKVPFLSQKHDFEAANRNAAKKVAGLDRELKDERAAAEEKCDYVRTAVKMFRKLRADNSREERSETSKETTITQRIAKHDCEYRDKTVICEDIVGGGAWEKLCPE